MAPTTTKRVTKVTKPARSKAASMSPTDHTAPRKKRQLKSALSTLNSSPAQNQLDAQLHYDLLSTEPESPSKHRTKGPSKYQITDAEFKTKYLAIQDMAWNWAQRFFKQDPSRPFIPSDLSKLATANPELMQYIDMTTSCAPTNTWEQMIHYKKAEIAFSILGKALEMHVFGKELFGGSEKQRRALQEKDVEMMDSDGFSRQHHRAIHIATLLEPHPPTTTTTNNPPPLPPIFPTALLTLRSQLLTLLHPLLPPQQQHPTNTPNTPIKQILSAILAEAAKLHLATRLQHSSIVYFPPAPAPGTRFDNDDMVSLSLSVNQGMGGGEGHTKRVARVTGWPGCVVYRSVIIPPPGDYHPRRQEDENNVLSGIEIHVLARAPVCVDVEPFIPIPNTKAHTKASANKKTTKSKTLKEELRDRRAESERRAGGWGSLALGMGLGLAGFMVMGGRDGWVAGVVE